MQELIQFDQVKADIALFVAPTNQIMVTDSKTNAVALDTLKTVKSFQKRIEEKRKDLVGPLNDRVKQINAYAGEIGEPLLEAEKSIRKKMADWAFVEAETRRKEQARIEEERRAAERKAAEERAALEAKEREKAKALSAFGCAPAIDQEAIQERIRLEREQKEREIALSRQARAVEASRPKNTRMVWTFKVKDANAIPREFLILDETSVRRAIAAGRREIAGIEIFEEMQIVAR